MLDTQHATAVTVFNKINLDPQQNQQLRRLSCLALFPQSYFIFLLLASGFHDRNMNISVHKHKRHEFD